MTQWTIYDYVTDPQSLRLFFWLGQERESSRRRLPSPSPLTVFWWSMLRIHICTLVCTLVCTPVRVHTSRSSPSDRCGGTSITVYTWPTRNFPPVLLLCRMCLRPSHFRASAGSARRRPSTVWHRVTTVRKGSFRTHSACMISVEPVLYLQVDETTPERERRDWTDSRSRLSLSFRVTGRGRRVWPGWR